MELIKKNINTLTMKYPSSWHNALWREGAVSGNGMVGINIYGGVQRETMIINHTALWTGRPMQELPDVSGCLAETRRLMDEGRFNEASVHLTNTLKETGYSNERGYPLPLAELNSRFFGFPGFSKYLRAVNMESGEISAQFCEGGVWVRKDAFVSRSDDMIVMRIRADKPILNAEFTLDMREGCGRCDEAFDCVQSKKKTGAKSNMLVYSSVNTDGLPFGAAARIEARDGTQEVRDNSMIIKDCSDVLIKIRVFINGSTDIDSLSDALLNESGDYNYYLDRHTPLHKALYHSAELELFENRNRSNEELLLDAYGGDAVNELTEKLWRFGRYLFISGTCDEGLPINMYGLWAGAYRATWSHYMANENVQMMYWHTHTGNLDALNRPMLEYYSSRMEYFRDCARKLYGCGGIFIPAGTTPNMPLPNQLVPVIMNWIGAAGWLAQHYYRHYLYTRDHEYLRGTILPFMKAAAEFYEDFIVFDDKLRLYPSISPENTPLNFIPEDNENAPHPMPTTINSTMDLAIVKELFTNLLALSEETGAYSEKADIWRGIIEAIPQYKVNYDGAVKEWQDDRFYDRYYHRHLSHIYPVFPGDEVTFDDERMAAFERAVDLRDIGAQTGWSLAHMASVYARLGRGNDAMMCLCNIARTCMMNNLFTLHNDWRRMDISLEMESSAPLQLDAAMGYVNAVQEMILFSSRRLVRLLPALPDSFKRGRITSWRFAGGSISMEWDIPRKAFFAELTAEHDFEGDIVLPDIIGSNTLHVKMKRGDILKLGEHL